MKGAEAVVNTAWLSEAQFVLPSLLYLMCITLLNDFMHHF